VGRADHAQRYARAEKKADLDLSGHCIVRSVE
jgi:hypothetical protein